MPFHPCPLSLADPKALALSTHTYGQLDQLAAAAATSLSFSNLQPGTLLAIRAEPNWQTLCLLFAAWRLSIPVALLPLQLPLLYSLPLHHLFEEISSLFQAPPCSEKKLNLSQPALLLLTSGSSGSPKWASFSLSQLFESAKTVADKLRAKQQESWLLSIPLHHVGGLGVALRCFLTGGKLLIEEKALPPQERINQANASYASLVPTQLYRLLKDPLFRPPPTHFLIGGAPLSKTLFEKACSRGFRISITYGLTEMSSTVLLSFSPIFKGAFPYLGQPLAGRKLMLAADGELLVKGASLFNGYGFPPQTPPLLFPTGDQAIYDPIHGWSIQGRKDFQFLSGGENIQPEEIEAALLSHKDVEEAIVVAKEDAEYGARPAAFVKTTLSKEALRSYLTQLLPKYKIPVLFETLKNQNSLKPSRKQLSELINKKFPFFNN